MDFRHQGGTPLAGEHNGVVADEGAGYPSFTERLASMSSTMASRS